LGVWKVQFAEIPATDSGVENLNPDTPILARHAQRGSSDDTMPLAVFFHLCEPYFAGSGRMIDQAYQSRLPEGMIRCYLTQERVVGFGHQAINALYPTPSGVNLGEAVQPGPRFYQPPSQPEVQSLKHKLEVGMHPLIKRFQNAIQQRQFGGMAFPMITSLENALATSRLRVAQKVS
jgi:hypothetical protein